MKNIIKSFLEHIARRILKEELYSQEYIKKFIIEGRDDISKELRAEKASSNMLRDKCQAKRLSR
jgi:hypothetical protein